MGGYAEEGRGMKGQSKAVVAAAKSWALGVPVKLHLPKVKTSNVWPICVCLCLVENKPF